MGPQQAVKKTILLADDARSMLDLEKSFFRREQFDILLAENGPQTYEMAIQGAPDIIFMDLDMGDMGGDEICLRFKAHPDLHNIPVVLVINPNNPDDRLRCQRAGCDDVLLKPPRQNQFLKTAEKHLSVPRRAAPRVEARMHVRYCQAGDEYELTDYSINVSTGGVFIETPEPLPVDTPLTLTFTIPGNAEPISCSGRVAWINSPHGLKHQRLPPGMGIQFVGLSLEEMAVLRAFVMRSLVTPEW
jgi:uncharacterized protein (TIGR02266 family)